MIHTLLQMPTTQGNMTADLVDRKLESNNCQHLIQILRMTFSNTALTQVSILQSVQQLLSRPAAAPVGQPDEDHDGLCSGFRNSVPVRRLSLLPVLFLPPASPSSVLWGRSLPELQARPVRVRSRVRVMAGVRVRKMEMVNERRKPQDMICWG